MWRPSISVIIPVFNEEANVGHAITLATRALETHASEHEVIVVDDASTDRSAAIVQELAVRDPRIVLLRHARNRKLGGTLRTGFAAASKDLVLYMDADLPFDPHDIGRAIRALELTRADILAAYRSDRTAEGLRRALLSYGYNLLIGILFGWPHRDVNFSFKLIRREVLDAIELRAEGSLISAELLVKARNLGFTVQQIGLDYFPRTRGTSTLASAGVVLTILRELVSLGGDMRRPKRRPVRRADAAAARTAEYATGAP
jgi:glycosyltransferase involved in cell wall biosynthesis